MVILGSKNWAVQTNQPAGFMCRTGRCVATIHETFTGNEDPLSTPWGGAVGDVFKSGGLAQVNVDGTDESGKPTYQTRVCHANQKCTLAATTVADNTQHWVAARQDANAIGFAQEFWQIRSIIVAGPRRGALRIHKRVGGVGSIEADSGFSAVYITPGQVELECLGNVITATTNNVSVNTTDGDSANGRYVGFALDTNSGAAVGAIESTSFDYVEAT